MAYSLDSPRSKSRVIENLSSRVYQQIKTLILSNQIMPGQKLYHQELSDRLGVSRTPVREALTRLVEEGYVSFLPNRGFTCREIGLAEAIELYELREALEAFAVEKAVERLTQPALDSLRRRIEQYGADLQRPFTRERLRVDQGIHLEIARLAGNETLAQMLERVFERIVLKRRTDGLYDPARGLIAHEEHVRLLLAIEQRDAGRAVDLIRAHIQEGKKNVLSDLERRLAIRELRPAGPDQKQRSLR